MIFQEYSGSVFTAGHLVACFSPRIGDLFKCVAKDNALNEMFLRPIGFEGANRRAASNYTSMIAKCVASVMLPGKRSSVVCEICGFAAFRAWRA